MELRRILILALFFILAGCAAKDSRMTPEEPGEPNSALSGTTGTNGGTADLSTASPTADDPKADVKISADKLDSIYTDLTREKCRSAKADEGSLSYSMECEGIAGYKLEVDEYDERQTVNVIYPDGTKRPLNFRRVVHPSFSSVGDTAEWRVAKDDGKAEPVALIVRFTFTVNPAISSEKASYLTVSKITKEKACVTDIVKAVKDQNAKARLLADASADKPCLKEEQWKEESDG